MFRFCKYYPTKLIPKTLYIEDYMPVFKLRPKTQDEERLNNIRSILSTMPLMSYLGYVIFLSEFNTINLLGLIGCYGIAQRSYNLRDGIESCKPRSIYLNKDGKSWVFIGTQSIRESYLFKDLRKANEGLRQLFNVPQDQIVISTEVTQIKMVAKLPNAQAVQNLFRMKDETVEMTQFLIETPFKQFIVDLNENEYSGMQDYIKAMLDGKQIII